jgi:hypothetical protein
MDEIWRFNDNPMVESPNLVKDGQHCQVAKGRKIQRVLQIRMEESSHLFFLASKFECADMLNLQRC